MSELNSHPEVLFSPRQERLIAAARQLLELPQASESKPAYATRPTTRKEKASRFLGWLARANSESSSPVDDFFNTPETETRTRDIDLKQLGGWGDRLSLRQVIAKDLGSGTTSESLVIRKIEVKNDKPAPTDFGSWYEDIAWSQELLQPIDDTSEIARLQAELDEAHARLCS